MDAERYSGYAEADNFWHVSQKSGDLDLRSRDGEGWKLVEVFLSGGAPWGFTLRGGLEHREPLLITKVEERSKAAAVCLQVGDELVSINDVPLSGYRQEAICLVKGSHKMLSLVVKRRNEPINRPHSWHSSKFNENQSETGKRQSSSTARNDTSSSASDISSGWELIDLPSTSNQFSSLDSMDNLEHVSHSYPADQLSPAKSNNGMEHLGERKRDSAYSSISTSSITPDCTKSNTASTENVPFKVFQWDAGAKKNDVRNSQSLVPEWVKHNDRFTYFQMPGVNSGHSGLQTEDSTGCRHSTSSRTNFGPVWNVPENKKPASPSPPPPLPPAHRDSFALTKVHERGIVSTHPEGPDSHENHHIFHKNHIENVNTSSDKFNHTHSSSKKQHSYLSVVQQGHDPHNRHGHQSDKSTSHPLTWAISVPKPPTEGGSYSVSLPTNRSTHFTQDHRQNLSTSLSSSNTDQNTDSTGSSRYYCVTTGQPTHQNRLSMSDVPEDRRGEADGENEQHTFKAQAGTRVKYHLSQQQQHSSHGKDSSAYSMHQVTTVPETYGLTPSSDYVGQKGHDTQTTECLYITNLAKRQPEQRKSLPAQIRDLPQDTRNHNQVNNKICPQTTPMFHSLSMDVTSQEEKVRDTKSEDFLEGKQVNRNSRFATTLRNEIQITARLQKSKSAATLPDAECVMEEDQNVWKSTENSTPASAGVCFSNSYKDHLKEAQARVLKATSFRRKDLEPVLQEHPAAEAQPSYTSSVQARKDVTPLPAVTESNNSGLSCGQVTRIGSRKRFPSEKKILSFSEPDKIHEVGVGESLTITENASSSLDHQYFLKEIIKPEFPNPIPPQSHSENEGDHHASCSSTENAMKEVKYAEEAPGVPHFTQSFQDYQRLGTFAEYEARWNIKKKPAENKASGRSHSADNILDPGPEDRMKTTCFHERSRSSPSADFYGQKVPSPVTKSDTECSHIESKPAEPTNLNTRFSDCASGKVAEKPAEFENYPAPPAPPRTGAKPDYRQGAAAAIMNHKSISYSFPEPDDHSYAEPPSSGQRRKASALEKPPPTRNQDVNSHESFTSFPNDVFAHRSANFEPNSTFHPIYSAKGDPEQGEGQGAVNHQSPPSPQSSPAFPYRPSRHYSMEGHCSPSPQFSPQRLSDKPPVSLHNDEANRMEQIIENQNTSVRKVPIRIVHSEGSVEKKNSPFLQQSDLPLIESKGHDVARLSSLRALGQDSVFSVFTSQKEPGKTAGSHMQQRDVYMTTVGDYSTSNSQQLLQPTDEPSRKRETTGLTEQEDQKRNVLARDIMWKDKSLVDILDQRKMKTTMDLMEGIFPQGEQLLEGGHHRKKVQPKRADSIPAEDREKEDSMAVAVAMMTSSTYYSTSAPKAELLIKMKDMQDQNEDDSEDELDMDLANKKQELIDSLSKKLHVLREAKESLLEDILDNNTLGNEVEVRVQQICKPNELEKFRMFVGDLDKAVSLLLSLSGRLARVENALNSLEEDATSEERRTLIEKRKLLIRQHEDAKELKENLDRREQVVYDILSSYLPEDSLADYEHFVKMKSALIIEQRKLEDKIKLGEEQLKCLTDSLPLEQRLAL